MQHLTILGNLGADAEVRVSNESKFVSFKVADTQRFTDLKGVVHESTSWVSCAWQGDGGRLLPYLKKGTKVLVTGRPSYKVYSSEKERAVKAGVDLHVISIELAGGSSDTVPQRLVNPDGGVLIPVVKCYWVQGVTDCTLYGERGGQYKVDANGFVTPEVDTQKTEAQPEQQTQSKDEVF